MRRFGSLLVSITRCRSHARAVAAAACTKSSAWTISQLRILIVSAVVGRRIRGIPVGRPVFFFEDDFSTDLRCAIRHACCSVLSPRARSTPARHSASKS